MKNIVVNNIKEGMVLAKDVVDINSRLLIPKGVAIEPGHIRVMKIWGITEISIAGDGEKKEPVPVVVDKEAVSKAKETVNEIFRHTDTNHPVIKEIIKQSIQYRCSSGNTTMDWEGEGKKAHDHSAPDTKILDINKKEIKLPEVPSNVDKLNDIIANPYAAAHDIAKVVNKSPSLAALLLKIVNSAFYGFPAKIDSISWAVTVIGTKEIVNLALGISIMEAFKDIPKGIVNMKSFLKHSFACGILARIIGAHKNIVQTEQLFVSGLLHDIGRLIVYKYIPDQAGHLIRMVCEKQTSLHRIEKEVAGLSHPDLGRDLLHKWKFPVGLITNVEFHHTPSKAQPPLNASIIHISDIIVTGLGIGSSGETYVPEFDVAAINKLDLPPSIFEPVIQQTLHQVKALESVYGE